MSPDMAMVIDQLQGDWLFIGEFLDDPNKALARFNLKEWERATLVARDARTLQALGVDHDILFGALSTLHSRQCTDNTKGCIAPQFFPAATC